MRDEPLTKEQFLEERLYQVYHDTLARRKRIADPEQKLTPREALAEIEVAAAGLMAYGEVDSPTRVGAAIATDIRAIIARVEDES